MTPPSLSHVLTFSVPAPYIAQCSRCGQRLKSLADVAGPCPGPRFEEKSTYSTLKEPARPAKGAPSMGRKWIGLLALGSVLAGCGSMSMRAGSVVYVPPLFCHHQDMSTWGAECRFEVTGDPSDAELWLFEARHRVVLNGIPFGREPVDQLVLGTQENCEAMRAAYRYKPHPFWGWDHPPTEPCKGPFYVKWLPVQADAR